jgi:hypothetical protein
MRGVHHRVFTLAACLTNAAYPKYLGNVVQVEILEKFSWGLEMPSQLFFSTRFVHLKFNGLYTMLSLLLSPLAFAAELA